MPIDVSFGIIPGRTSGAPSSARESGIARGNYSGGFDHEDYRALWRSSAMNDAFRNDKALPFRKFDALILEIDDEAAFEHKEKFVVVVVLVPMIFTLHDAKANHRIIDPTQGLVVPLVGTRGYQGRHVDQAQRRKKHIEKGCVRIFLRGGHGALQVGPIERTG